MAEQTTPALTYVEVALDAVLLGRHSQRQGRTSLVGKSLPVEVCVYYSDIARGCVDDQYLKVLHCRTAIKTADLSTRSPDSAPRVVTIPLDLSRIG